MQDHQDGVAFLVDRTAELLDRGVIKLAERVKVSNLLVVIESGRGTLLESKNAYIHCDHVPADKHIDVVEAAVAPLFFLLFIREDVIIVFASRRRRVRRAEKTSALVSRTPVCRVLAIVDRGWSVGQFWSNFGRFQSNSS